MKFVRFKTVVLAPREEHERLLLIQGLLNPLEASWQATLSTGDVDLAWALWTTAAEEETLLALDCPDITPDSLPDGATLTSAPPHLPCGWGTDQLLREVRLCPKPHRDNGGPLSCPVARIHAAHGPLRHVLCWLERPAPDVGVMPRRVQQAWAALRRRLERLCTLGPAYASLELDGSHERLAQLASLRRLHTTLAGKIRATLRVEEKDRLHGWRSWLRRPSPLTRGQCNGG